MDVKQIIVDELPENCIECEFSQGIIPENLFCIIANEKIKCNPCNKRPSWCPLEVEQVCEWTEDKEGCFMTIHETGGVAPENHEFTFCPDCGKRIKYIEEER